MKDHGSNRCDESARRFLTDPEIVDEITRNKPGVYRSPHWSCSLKAGHTGPHIAYEHHDCDSAPVLMWEASTIFNIRDAFTLDPFAGI